MDKTNVSIGIENSLVKIANGKFVCSFDRQNDVNKQGYFKIDSKIEFYMIAAYGSGMIN